MNHTLALALIDHLISIGFLISPDLLEKINNTKRLSEIDLEDYDAILFSGGSGTFFDYPDNTDIHKAIRSMWKAGKLVSSVCAGGSALLNAKLIWWEEFGRRYGCYWFW